MIIIGLLIYCTLFVLYGQQQVEQRVRQTCARDAQLPGMFWDGQQCLKCRSDLCFCITYLGCDSCKEGYYLDFDEKKCAQCPVGCSSCCKLQKITKLICTECDPSYMILNGVCVENKVTTHSHLNYEGCIKISPHGKCAECSKLNSYYKNDKGKCSECPQGCYQCTQQNYCTLCDPGYYLDIFYHKDKKFKESLLECSDCLPGYFFDQENKNCLSCPKNCLVCDDPRIKQTDLCLQCDEDHILDAENTHCISCTLTIANCLTCEQIDENGKVKYQCIECKNEYYLDMTTYQCLSCKTFEGVLRCETPDVITQCEDDYLLIELPNIEKLEYKCIFNKYQCRSAVNATGSCIDCKEGYHLAQIETSTNSTSIEENDVKSKFLECQSCKETIENCIECVTNENDFTLSCLICENTYYLVEGKCYQCTENCLVCENPDVCITCLEKYYKTDEEICEFCEHDHCNECMMDEQTQLIKCLKCENGFGLNLINSCWQCQEGCIKCNFKRDVCQECEDRYYLQMGTCIRYPDKCLLANQEGFCYLCDTVFQEKDEVPVEAEEEEVQQEGEEGEGGEEGEDEGFDIGDLFGMRVLASEEEGEGEEVEVMKESLFYMSVNGYCILCSDFQTGSYTCPNTCNAELLSVPSLGVMVGVGVGLAVWLL